MKETTDTISIELNVTAVQMDAKIWMQGDLKIFINGTKPYSESDVINPELLIRSSEANGEYFIFSCCCGLPECSSWTKGMQVTRQGNIFQWIDLNTGKTWRLDADKIAEDLLAAREQVKIFKQFFRQKQIEYVGVGYNW